MIEVMGNITVRPFSAYSVNGDGDVVVRSIFPHKVETHTAAWASELGWDSDRAQRLADHLNVVVPDDLPRTGRVEEDFVSVLGAIVAPLIGKA